MLRCMGRLGVAGMSSQLRGGIAANCGNSDRRPSYRPHCWGRVWKTPIYKEHRDDHAKNFSFLMDENGLWQTSPAYDLTFSFGPSAEHCTIIAREGKNPGVSHLIALAKTVSITETKANEIITEVKEAVSNWSQFAKEAGVSPRSTKDIQKEINICLSNR